MYVASNIKYEMKINWRNDQTLHIYRTEIVHEYISKTNFG